MSEDRPSYVAGEIMQPHPHHWVNHLNTCSCEERGWRAGARCVTRDVAEETLTIQDVWAAQDEASKCRHWWRRRFDRTACEECHYRGLATALRLWIDWNAQEQGIPLQPPQRPGR